MARELLRESLSPWPFSSPLGDRAFSNVMRWRRRFRSHTKMVAMPPMRKRPAPTAMPTMVPVVMVEEEAPASFSVMFWGAPVISSGVLLKGEPERPRSLPGWGCCSQPDFREIKTMESC
jgi:hypothetical protein